MKRHSIWISMLLLLAALGAHATNAATITVINGDGANEGFNDTTPAAPVGGNPGTTLGQQRWNVFNQAVQIWGSRLQSDVKIKVKAQFNPLACTADAVTIGSARATDFRANFAGAPQANTWYPIALAEALAKTNLNGSEPEITATFNSATQADCIGSAARVWYGITQTPASHDDIDLLQVALRELAQGLGVTTLACRHAAGCGSVPLGGYPQNMPDISARFIGLPGTPSVTWKDMSDAQRAASIVNANLVWTGANAVSMIPQSVRSGVDPQTLQMYVHVPSSAKAGAIDYLDLTMEQLQDIGWALIDTPLNDPPVIYAPASIGTVEDGLGVALNAISFDDVDAGQGTLVATISIPSGTGSLAIDSTFVAGVVAFVISPSELRLYGPLAGLNTYLRDGHASFRPAADVAGDVPLTIKINDGGFTGSGGAQETNAVVTLTIFATNDPPTIAAPSIIKGWEDVPVSLAGISFSDVDAGQGNVQATFSVSAGLGSVNATSSGGVAVSGSGSSRILTGTLAAINNFLAAGNLTYVSALNAHGTFALTVDFNDNGNTGSVGPRSARTLVSMEIASLDDAPTIAAPIKIRAEENVATALSGISIGDVDAGSGRMEVSFFVPFRQGRLSLNTTPADGVSATLFSEASAITIRGTLSALNNVLAAGRLSFTSLVNAPRTLTLQINVNDQGNTGAVLINQFGLEANQNVALEIFHVNQAPVVSVPSSIVVQEDVATGISGVVLDDVDAPGTAIVSATFSVPPGQGTLSGQAMTGVVVLNASAEGLAVAATLDLLKAYVASNNVRYLTAPNATNNVPLTITLYDAGATGDGGPRSGSAITTLSVTAVNDAPSVFAPTTICLPALLRLNLAQCGTIAFADVDAGSVTMTASFSVPAGHGILGATPNSGVTTSGTGNAVTLQGTISNINAYIAAGNIRYAAQASSPDTIVINIAISDGGATGIGGPKSASGSLTVRLPAGRL